MLPPPHSRRTLTGSTGSCHPSVSLCRLAPHSCVRPWLNFAKGATAQDDVDSEVKVIVAGLEAITTSVATPSDGQVRQA